MKKPAANESEDWYLMPDGRLVFTEAYHWKRGYCCGSGCRHCPFEYDAVPEPRRSELLARRGSQNATDA